MSLSFETACLFPEAVVVVAAFVGAVAEDSVLSLLPPDTASLFLSLVAALAEVASETVALFLEIPFLLIEGTGVVEFLEVAAG